MPASRSSATRSKIRSVVDVITTRFPAAPIRRADAYPIPAVLPAPVMMATLSGRFSVMVLPLVRSIAVRRSTDTTTEHPVVGTESTAEEPWRYPRGYWHSRHWWRDSPTTTLGRCLTVAAHHSPRVG